MGRNFHAPVGLDFMKRIVQQTNPIVQSMGLGDEGNLWRDIERWGWQWRVHYRGDIASKKLPSRHVIRPEDVYGNGGRYSPPLASHWSPAEIASAVDQ